jgi:Na+/H+-dicarboxylate symporter
MGSLLVFAVLIAAVLAMRLVVRAAGWSASSAATLQIVVAMLLGFLVAWQWPETAAGFGWMGEVFLRMLKMIVVPLVVASVIVGISSLGDIRKLGRTGVATLAYYAATTALAVLLGIIVVNALQPGAGVPTEGVVVAEKIAAKSKGLAAAAEDIVLGFFSENVMWAASAEKPQMLPLIVFALFFGAALTTIGERGRPVIAFFEGINAAIISIVHWILVLVPFGVFGLIAGRLGLAGAGFWIELAAIGKYALTVIIGLAIHGVIVLPLILWLFTGRSPLAYVKGMAEALMTAFSTASSSATYPLTLECSVQNNRVSKRSAMFVLPIGATVNMDGTALYESVAAIFIAQAYGIHLGPVEQAVIFITASLAAIGAAGIPEAGLFTMVIVLNAVGLPLEGVSLILAVDWFLDRCRTTVNVWGDAIGAAVIDKVEGFDASEASPVPIA